MGLTTCLGLSLFGCLVLGPLTGGESPALPCNGKPLPCLSVCVRARMSTSAQGGHGWERQVPRCPLGSGWACGRLLFTGLSLSPPPPISHSPCCQLPYSGLVFLQRPLLQILPPGIELGACRGEWQLGLLGRLALGLPHSESRSIHTPMTLTRH